MYSELNSWSTRHGYQFCLFLLGLLLSIPPVDARPQGYGEYFVRLGQQWSDGDNAKLPADGAPGPVAMDEYQQRRDALEQQGGPYEDGLAEPLGALARYHRDRGDYAQALSAYRRALHVVRINDGLYSERQIPLLRGLLGTFRAAGDFDALDQRYDYFFRLYGNGKPPYSKLRIGASLEYLRWQREALRRELGGNDKKRLLDLVNLTDDLLGWVAADIDAPYAWQRELTYSQLRNLYLLQHRFTPSLQEQGLVSSREFMGMQPLSVDFEDKRIDAMLREAPSKGSALLQQLQATGQGQEAVEQASLQLVQADWYWWNGDRRRAETGYGAVVSLLEQAGETGLLQEWLGHPVELPDNGAFWQPSSQRPADDAVRVRFDVSARGRVSNIEARPLSGEPESRLSSFKRRLAGTLFRPRWASGAAEAVSSLQRDYQLLD